jgi:aspartate-semialdehyde dehydrogenase
MSLPPAYATASAHPATIVLCLLLLRLATRAGVEMACAHVFSPASHLGPRAIDELQKQTVNLLSFQNIPSAVFGSQLAFNLLPRLAGSGTETLTGLENRVRAETQQYLAGSAPVPALRFIQTPVFYSLGVSLYVETASAITPSEAASAISGERVRLRRPSEIAPSQAEVTGSDEVVIDSVTADAARPNGLWIWAAADNLRLAAQNAVEIAEDFTGQKSSGPRPASRSTRRTGKAGVH